MPMKTKTSTTSIKLTAEASKAIARIGPSDNRLLFMLNSNAEEHMPDSATVRWMAYHILCMNGYKFEEA